MREFTNARLDLGDARTTARLPCRGTRPSEGAANAGFKPGHASPIAAEATREQGKSKRPTKTKSGRELEWTRDETPIV